MLQVSLSKVKKYYGSNLILDGIDLEVSEGEKIGLIGGNGSGKSTLFKIINKTEDYQEGRCTYKKNLKVGYLIQDFTPYHDFTVKEVLYDGFRDLLHLEMRLLEASMNIEDYESVHYEKNLEEFGRLQEEFEHLGGYEIEDKIKKVRIGLRIPEEFMEKKVCELSGGEKNRVFLGKALVDEPELLLLDEPTNHLDLSSIKWLEEFVKSYKKSILLISHDRYFLDNTIDKIYELTERGIETYHGNYSYYVVERERRYLKELEEYLMQQKEIKRMEEAIRRFRHWGSNSGNEAMFVKAENMRKRIERMEKAEKPQKARELKLNIEANRRTGNQVLRVEGLTRMMEDRLLFKDISFRVYKGEALGFLGGNGVGKTTLLNMIIEGRSGVTYGSNLKIAYLDQNLTFDEPELTVRETFLKETQSGDEASYGKLAGYNFFEEDLNKKVASLSGGEKARLKIAIMINSGFNLLILDEPTNHLDLQLREVLEEALEEFDGTIFFISHDRYFLNKIATRIIELKDKKLWEYEGDFNYYLSRQEEEEEEEEEKPLKKEDTRYRSNQMEKDLQRELKKLMDSEEKLTTRLEKIAEEEIQADLDYVKLEELYKERTQLEEEYERNLERVYEIEELLEDIRREKDEL